MKFRLHHIPQILADTVLISAALFLAFLMRFEGSVPAAEFDIFRTSIAAIVLIKLIVFFLSGLYDRMWRYVSIRELYALLKAAVASELAIVVFLFTIQRSGFPRSVVAIDAVLTVLFVGGARFAVRSIYETRKHRSVLAGSKPVLVFGAGDAGEMIVREMLKHPDMEYDPVGFVDDDVAKRGRRIHGIEVLGTHEDIPRLADKYEVEEIIVAIPSAPSRVIREAMALCDQAGVTCKTLPGVFELIDGRVELSQIRAVKVEDLLGREPVRIDLTDASHYLQGACVLVTGAAGSIGSELCRQIARFAPERLILFDHNENDLYFLAVELGAKQPSLKFKTVVGDIKDVGFLDNTFARFRPEVVFHAAAHKHVPLMQENPSAAVSNNVTGSRNVIEMADRYKVGRFVLISTDKAVDPTGIMGTTKRISEMVMQARASSSKTKFMAVRFGNVIGSNGSVAPVFKRQIEQGGPVTVTHPEATRYFMSVSEATQLVLQAGALGGNGEIFMLDMGEPVRIIDLARNLIRLSGFEPEVDIPIKIIGLRAGDEINEDLVGKNEKLVKTARDKVFVVENGVSVNQDGFPEDLEKLEHLVDKHDVDKIHQQMAHMIPSYKLKASPES